jgi:hypothetical protein
MIDTLKLARRLEAAQMSKEQAEALAEGLNESLAESYVTREYLDSRLSQLQTRLTLSTLAIVIGVVGIGNGILFWLLTNTAPAIK